MAGEVTNIKVCSPLKQRSRLTGNYHAICHYSYNLPLAVIVNVQALNARQKLNLLLTNCIILFRVML